MIELEPGRNFEQALEDLGGFERIWVLSLVHGNRGWRSKELPPRGDGRRRGVFATRSPHRPNPIGLSLLRLLEVRGLTLRVADVDLLDRTPILDIRPYLPYAEAFPDAAAGWLEETIDRERAAGYLRVEWSPFAHEQFASLQSEHGIELRRHVAQVILNDPHPHPYRRISP